MSDGMGWPPELIEACADTEWKRNDQGEVLLWVRATVRAILDAAVAWRDPQGKPELLRPGQDINDVFTVAHEAVRVWRERAEAAERDRDLWHKIAKEEGQRVERERARIAALEEEVARLVGLLNAWWADPDNPPSAPPDWRTL